MSQLSLVGKPDYFKTLFKRRTTPLMNSGNMLNQLIIFGFMYVRQSSTTFEAWFTVETFTVPRRGITSELIWLSVKQSR